jgi:hypothetical protein
MGHAHELRISDGYAALAESSILDEKKFGRDKLFVHTRFLRLLTRDDNSFKRYV